MSLPSIDARVLARRLGGLVVPLNEPVAVSAGTQHHLKGFM